MSWIGLTAALVMLGAQLAPEEPSTTAHAPELFPPEIRWPAGTDLSPAFAPDGTTMFFTHAAGTKRTIMISHLRDGKWSDPEIASFSGQWRDIEPAMAPDGSYLVFVSNRPEVEGGKPLDGFFAGAARPAAGGNLWRVDRTGNGWGTPVRLPAIVNSDPSTYSPAVARNGDIFFMRPNPISHRFWIYRAKMTAGQFSAPEPLSFSSDTISDVDPAVAPDGSFIVFASTRAPSPTKTLALFIAYRDGDHWKAPVVFDPMLLGTEARLSPDLSTLYFESNRPTPTSPEPAPGADSRIWRAMLNKSE